MAPLGCQLMPHDYDGMALTNWAGLASSRDGKCRRARNGNLRSPEKASEAFRNDRQRKKTEKCPKWTPKLNHLKAHFKAKFDVFLDRSAPANLGVPE